MKKAAFRRKPKGLFLAPLIMMAFYIGRVRRRQSHERPTFAPRPSAPQSQPDPGIAAPVLAVAGGAVSAPPAPSFPAVRPPVAPDTPLTPSAPVAQITAAFTTLGHAASQNLVVRLHPEELGAVQITVTRPSDGPVSVALVAERPETLLLLLRDQPHLNHTLDQAGLPSDARTLTFDLAPVRMDATASAHQNPDQPPHSSNLDFGAPRDDQARPDQPPAMPARQASPQAPLAAPVIAPPARIAAPAGLDITA